MRKGTRMLLMTNNTDKKKKEEESRRKIEENRQRDMETQRNLERYRDDTYNEKYGLENRYRSDDSRRSRNIPYENPIRVAYDDGAMMRYGGEYGRVDPDGDGYVGYGDMMPESRFRDRRGRDHYDNGRYAPQNYWGAGGDDSDTYMESRRGGARRRDSRGRFTNEYDEDYNDDGDMDPSSNNGGYWPSRVPPIYQRSGNYNRNRSNRSNRNSRSREGRPMNKIGFSIDGEWENLPDEMDSSQYRMDATHRGIPDEMMYNPSRKSNGYAMDNEVPELDKEMAMEWTENMQNEDGTTGPHWSMEQVKQLMAQKNIECDPICFYACLNMMYSDYCKVAKKLGVNNMDFYVCMAKAFLDDKDFKGTPEEKLGLYFTEIVDR